MKISAGLDWVKTSRRASRPAAAGLPAHYYAKAEPLALTPMQRLDVADRFFAATRADIRHGGTRAYYAEGPDYVLVACWRMRFH